MTQSLLGLPLSEALRRLEAAGQEPGEITVIRAPRGNSPRGTLRVVRVREDGKGLVCGEFADHAAMDAETNNDAEKNESENS